MTKSPRTADTAGGMARSERGSVQVVGYVRVSTDEQRMSGAGLDAQRRAILQECKRRGWRLVEFIEDAERIRRERAAGASLRQIAGGLNADGVPTPRGGSEWRPSSLERLLGRLEIGGAR